jgi:hypothetical protein
VIFRVVEHVVPPIQVLGRGFLPAEIKGGMSSRHYHNLTHSAGDILVHLTMIVPPQKGWNIPELYLAQRVCLQPGNESPDYHKRMWLT